MFSRNLALIIGINNYKNGISPLNTAVNDAKKLVEILRTKHDYQVWECLDEVATLSNFNKFLSHTLPEQVTENDRLLFYFAGHGVALNGDDGPAGYLIPQDASLGDTNSYLPMTKLHDALSQLPCRHFLGILDCCFAGAFKWSNTRDLLTLPEVIHQERYDRFITDPAWQIITSSASDQKALDNFYLDSERGQVGNHSPFAAALLEALEGAADIYPPAKNGKPVGDGVITATELYLHLRDRVEIPTEKCRLRQTPGIWCLNKHDKGEYIFLSPGHELNLPPAPPLDESQNPYRGLASFDEKHSSLFFGRTELVEKLQDFVKANPLTVVLGASGSGKSSLVKAGLIPKLRQDNTETWCILPPIRPGETPLQGLNNVLCNAKLPNVEPRNPQHNLARTIDVWAKDNPNSKLLLFIDQSEEIITLCQNLDERKEFFQQILTAINAHGDKLRVVLTLRSDFEAQVRDAGLRFVPTDYNLGNTVLKNRWHSRRFIVPGMTRGELKKAIEKPAEIRVMYFQPHELVEELINEVADMPGALPLLSFALSELYLKYLKRQRQAQYRGITIDRALTQADYIELGGVMRSLTQRADEEYEALVKENPAYEQVICHVMLRMVALTGGELARRRVPLSELEYPPEKNGLVKEVIERFTNTRLLVTGEDADGNPYVEPAHDALVRGWEKLRNWVQQEKNLELQRRLTPSALEWNDHGKTRFLWNANPYLDVLNKEVLKSPDNNWLNQVEAEFVLRSVKRRRRNTQRNWGIALGVMLGLSGLTILSFIALREALIGQVRASQEASEANLPSNELQALVDSLRAAKSLQQPLLLLFKPKNQLQNQVRGTLLQAVHGIRESNRLEEHSSRVMSVVFSPNGERIAATSGDSTVKVWNRNGILEANSKQRGIVFTTQEGKFLTWSVSSENTDNIEIRRLDGTLLQTLKDANFRPPNVMPHLFVKSVVFSPDEKRIAVAHADGKVQLWKPDGTLIRTLKGHSDFVNSVVFSPNGEMIASASWDKTVKLWKPDGTLIRTLKGHNHGASKVAFSPDSNTLASASYDNTVKLWKPDGTLIGTLEGHNDGVYSVAFSPNGEMIASASWDKTVKLWKMDGSLERTLYGHRSTVSSLAFSPDSKTLASASTDTTVKLWKLDNTKEGIIKAHRDTVNSVAFSPNDEMIASAGRDKTIKLWKPDGTLIRTLKGHSDSVNSVVFSPNGEMIASASSDKMVKLWKPDGTLIGTLKGHRDSVDSVVFSPNGEMIASAGSGVIKLWKPDGSFIRNLEGYVSYIVFSPDSQMIIASAGWGQGLLQQLDGTPVTTLPSYGYGVRSVAFSPDGQMIALGSSEPKLSLLKPDGTFLRDLQGHDDDVNSVAFSPDGQMIASASSDGTVKLWERNGALLSTLKGYTDHEQIVVDFSPDGNSLVWTSGDGKVILWNLNLDDLLVRGCNWVREYLENNPNVDESDRHLCDNLNK